MKTPPHRQLPVTGGKLSYFPDCVIFQVHYCMSVLCLCTTCICRSIFVARFFCYISACPCRPTSSFHYVCMSSVWISACITVSISFSSSVSLSQSWPWSASNRETSRAFTQKRKWCLATSGQLRFLWNWPTSYSSPTRTLVRLETLVRL